jgi:DNA-binding HxlR family transcriptional regulator
VFDGVGDGGGHLFYGDEAAPILSRSQYSEHPPRYDYELTVAGRALIPVLHSLRTWGEQFAAPGLGAGGRE